MLSEKKSLNIQGSWPVLVDHTMLRPLLTAFYSFMIAYSVIFLSDLENVNFYYLVLSY